MTVAWRRSPSSLGPAVEEAGDAGTAGAAGAASAPHPVQKRCPAKIGAAHCGQGTPTGAPQEGQNRAPAGMSAWQRAQVIGVRAARKRHHRPAAKAVASVVGRRRGA